MQHGVRTCQKCRLGDCDGNAYSTHSTGSPSVSRLASEANATTCAESPGAVKHTDVCAAPLTTKANWEAQWRVAAR